MASFWSALLYFGMIFVEMSGAGTTDDTDYLTILVRPYCFTTTSAYDCGGACRSRVGFDVPCHEEMNAGIKGRVLDPARQKHGVECIDVSSTDGWCLMHI